MKSMIRVNALKLSGYGPKTLRSMEDHGKRLDGTSQLRRIRDKDPLVYNTLDLRKAYDEHSDGCRMNAGLSAPVLHAIIKFPKELPITEANQMKMMNHSVKFINQTYGGDAVFAARVDRDEEGEHIVDVFYSPRYTKKTKDRKKNEVLTKWISTTKHGDILCEKHRVEIMSRNNQGKFTTTPRSVGIALQSELHAYFLEKVGIKLEPKQPKDTYRNDRMETELYKLREKARAELEAAQAMKGEALRELDQAKRIKQDQQRICDAAAEMSARSAAIAVSSLFQEDGLRRNKQGEWNIDQKPELKGIWAIIEPTMNKLANWWERMARKVKALPEPDQPQNEPLVLDDPDDLPEAGM